MTSGPCEPVVSCGISTPLGVLSPCRRQVSHALLTRLPLSPDRSLDHVRLACVRHAASVRSEPGSNSQVENQILNYPWMESSKGSLRFDEFPTNMKRRNPLGLRATRLLAYENARPSESRCQPLLKRAGTQGLRRLRFPFFVSQCQRAVGREANAPLPNPRWKQILHLKSTTAEASLE